MDQDSAIQLIARIIALADSILETATLDATNKQDGSLVTEADTRMQSGIQRLLENLTPEFSVMGEEMSPNRQVKALRESSSCWVLDPIDGTSNFSSGLPFYCTSLALVTANETRFGMVYDPCRKECFWALPGEGAWLNQQRLHGSAPSTLKRCIGLVDMKRLDEKIGLALLRDSPLHSMRNLGAVALEWCWIAAGRGHVYLHGRQQLWDYSAAQLILREAGGAAIDLNGDAPEPLRLEPRGMIAAMSPQLLDQWREWIAQYEDGIST